MGESERKQKKKKKPKKSSKEGHRSAANDVEKTVVEGDHAEAPEKVIAEITDEPRPLVSEAWQRHKKIVQRLNREEALMQLCDPSRLTKLELPSISSTKFSPPRSFTYVGRPQLRSLLEEIEDKNKPYIQFRGHPGRGKSYVLAALASYLHTYEQEGGVVVYIILSRLVWTEAKLAYVLQALLLGFARHWEKQWLVTASKSSKCWLSGYNFKDVDINDLPLHALQALFYTGLVSYHDAWPSLFTKEIGNLELPPDIFSEWTFGNKPIVSVLRIAYGS
ncbi:hypothetical protein SELMODRAFT_429837 [Selaginella moellendorffii]|uniref:Uncharacterized protein n=1 Tax=Selaginella moellendorffii TaxID=88036 RepID=D8T7G7_SELML|nr:hypothetical protein SELMODRAFT_429837 [Selaginella moellendorffii]